MCILERYCLKRKRPPILNSSSWCSPTLGPVPFTCLPILHPFPPLLVPSLGQPFAFHTQARENTEPNNLWSISYPKPKATRERATEGLPSRCQSTAFTARICPPGRLRWILKGPAGLRTPRELQLRTGVAGLHRRSSEHAFFFGTITCLVIFSASKGQTNADPKGSPSPRTHRIILPSRCRGLFGIGAVPMQRVPGLECVTREDGMKACCIPPRRRNSRRFTFAWGHIDPLCDRLVD